MAPVHGYITQGQMLLSAELSPVKDLAFCVNQRPFLLLEHSPNGFDDGWPPDTHHEFPWLAWALRVIAMFGVR